MTAAAGTEPDGLIDHLMIFRSSVGEKGGVAISARMQIWAHRWNLGAPTHPQHQQRTAFRRPVRHTTTTPSSPSMRRPGLCTNMATTCRIYAGR